MWQETSFLDFGQELGWQIGLLSRAGGKSFFLVTD